MDDDDARIDDSPRLRSESWRREEDGGSSMVQLTNCRNWSPAAIPSTCTSSAGVKIPLHDLDPEQALETGENEKRERTKDVYSMDENDQILEIKSARFYRRSFIKDMLFAFFSVLTGGLAMVLCFSYPRVYASLRFIEVEQSDREAELVLVESLDGMLTLAPIQCLLKKGDEESWMPASKAHFVSKKLRQDRMFVWRDERFWYNDEGGSWTRRAFNVEVTYDELHTIAHDIAIKEVGYELEGSRRFDSRKKRFLAYGYNQLTVAVPSLGRLLMTEVFKPFFIFQVFSIGIWMYQQYTIYAYVILSMTVVAVLFSVLETRRNLQAVQKLAASECEVRILTLKTAENETAGIAFKPEIVSSSQLLPGDIVEIEAGMVFPCDLVLLAGQCVVNESMLTGESAPVPKTPLPLGTSAPGQMFKINSERDASHMLLSGTTAIQIRGTSAPHLHSFADPEICDEQPSIWQFLQPRGSSIDRSKMITETVSVVAAMVVRTAYGTTKGQLVRAIRFPKPSKFDFERKLYYFVANSVVYLVVVCAITVYFQVGKESGLSIFLQCLNLITIAVPAALPLALSIGISVSFNRLKEDGVYCVNPSRIVAAGRVDTVCFDKTGTITEDGLNLTGVVPVVESEAKSSFTARSCGPLQQDPQTVYLQGQQALVGRSDGKSTDKTSVSSLGLFYTLATCHSISVLDERESAIANEDRIRDHSAIALWFHGFWKIFESFSYKYTRAATKESTEGPEQEAAGAQEPCHFIGDPLEIQMFISTGWRYISGPAFHELLWSVNRPNTLPAGADVLRMADVVITAPDGGDPNPLLAILRRFDFDSEIRLMSSIVLELLAKDSNEDSIRSWMFVKGAPESLQEICLPETLPHDFTSQLHGFTHQGYRVLACAYRTLESMTVPQMMAARRQEMERELIFCGFLIMENRLKPETPGVLFHLAEAGMREVMVTGDNPYTAAAVARQSGPFFLEPSRRTYLLDQSADFIPEKSKSCCVLKDIDYFTEEEIDVDEMLLSQIDATNMATSNMAEGKAEIAADIDLVVTGRAFAALTVQHNHLRENFMKRSGSCNADHDVTECVTPLQMVLTRAGIFCRMTPQHKMELMRSLQDLRYVVCMTGDGANDSGALKAADVGISISSRPVHSTDTTAAGPSIAAPFSSKLSHIGAVPVVLAEGRCALVTATVMFKYMFFYALIQATSVLVLYRILLELYDYQYLWVDLALVLPLVVFMPATRPREKLTPGRPEDNLLAPAILASVYGHGVLIIAFQVLAQMYLQHQSWYTKPNDAEWITSKFTDQHNYNSTVSFLFSSFQYLGLAMTLSQSFGKFRKSPFTNIWLSATLICQFVVCSMFLLKPMKFAADIFSLVQISDHKFFVLSLWMMAIINSLLSILFERFTVRPKSSGHYPPKSNLRNQKLMFWLWQLWRFE
ncbi:hypothetical protein R1flu_001994 [Riccia fluitans]|uniref:P-type ATPase A domain-containing protein n=1 Tax=Riccia fluitans TaxID=41844 RepID=A0ABD1Y5V6_9MARC